MSVNLDPRVMHWLNQLHPNSRRQYAFVFGATFAWLRSQPGFETITPSGLIKLQRANNRKAPTDDDDLDPPELILPKMLKSYVNSKDVRLQTKVTQWSTIKSFFKYSDTVFPDPQSVTLQSQKKASASELSLEVILKCITAAKLRDRAWLLVKWQSFQDQERMDYINRNLTEHIVSEMQKGRTMIRLDLLGRKNRVKGENEPRPFYTFIGKDAVEALREYFEKERGWPKKGEALWLNLKGEPFEYAMYSEIWLSLLRRLGYVPKQEENAGVDRRYGYGIHQFRDVAISYLHTHAKSRGLDLDAIHFMLGHTKNLDPNKYDTFFEDANYGVAQYQIAEPFLDIISNPTYDGTTQLIHAEMESKLKERDQVIAELQSRVSSLETVWYTDVDGNEVRGSVLNGWPPNSKPPAPVSGEESGVVLALKSQRHRRRRPLKAQKRSRRRR